mmetsp:Transcript_26729/g.86551  ORF Transcript_26729/g.86551 Transcript_26729/m.86551 type:complete len:225 (+) Transcript_26729:1124-1798(+)
MCQERFRMAGTGPPKTAASAACNLSRMSLCNWAQIHGRRTARPHRSKAQDMTDNRNSASNLRQVAAEASKGTAPRACLGHENNTFGPGTEFVIRLARWKDCLAHCEEIPNQMQPLAIIDCTQPRTKLRVQPLALAAADVKHQLVKQQNIKPSLLLLLQRACGESPKTPTKMRTLCRRLCAAQMLWWFAQQRSSVSWSSELSCSAHARGDASGSVEGAALTAAKI